MNIINRINNLPLVLQNKIFNYYWRHNYDNIIENFDMFIYNLNKMLLFLIKHFINNESLKYNKQISFYLIKYNEFLSEIKNNKGYDLFCKININGYNAYIFDEKVHEKILKDVDKRLHYLCIFCIQEFTDHRYRILFNLKELTNSQSI